MSIYSNNSIFILIKLRILHRLINAILGFVIQILTNIPIYEISLYFINTSFISGISFRLEKNLVDQFKICIKYLIDKVFYSIEETKTSNEKKTYIIRSKV